MLLVGKCFELFNWLLFVIDVWIVFLLVLLVVMFVELFLLVEVLCEVCFWILCERVYDEVFNIVLLRGIFVFDKFCGIGSVYIKIVWVKFFG